ncbi:MAG: alpha-ribazole phosphatase [Nitrospirae bacterium]|nr:alpha-ribazole phosphatase [Nitrospirota bacterium]
MIEDQGTTTVFLIRHGHTVGGEERRYKGHMDVELSEAGERSMQRLAENLAGLDRTVDAVYCSDLKRAMKSASILSAALGLEPVVVPELRERSFGRWEGMSFEEISEAYPEEFSRWKQDPLRFSPPAGESTLEVELRTLSAVNSLIERHRGGMFWIVAHGGVNRIILCHFMGLPLENIFRIEQDYGCLNIVEIYGDGFPVIKLLNGGPGCPAR